MNTIIVIGAGLLLQSEGSATESIEPGAIVEESAAGEFARCNAAQVDAPLTVALENSNIGGTVDDAYPVGDQVIARTLIPGAVFYGRLPAAAPAVAFGARMTLNGDGGFQIAAGAEIVKAIAKEAVDNSGGASSVLVKLQAI